MYSLVIIPFSGDFKSTIDYIKVCYNYIFLAQLIIILACIKYCTYVRTYLHSTWFLDGSFLRGHCKVAIAGF